MKTEITVNRQIIDEWIKTNGPDGLSKLATKSKVPSSTIGRARRGIVPRSILIREALAEALESTEQAVFPTVGIEDAAS
jgi:hypothetical protein